MEKEVGRMGKKKRMQRKLWKEGEYEQNKQKNWLLQFLLTATEFWI